MGLEVTVSLLPPPHAKQTGVTTEALRRMTPRPGAEGWVWVLDAGPCGRLPKATVPGQVCLPEATPFPRAWGSRQRAEESEVGGVGSLFLESLAAHYPWLLTSRLLWLLRRTNCLQVLRLVRFPWPPQHRGAGWG